MIGIKKKMIPYAEKGVANGVAELDGSGKVPLSQIPTIPGIGDVSCTAYRNAVQSIPPNVWTAIQLNAEEKDTDNMHDNITNNTKIIIPIGKDGPYTPRGMGTFAGNSNYLRGIAIQKNGAPGVGTTIIEQRFNPAASQPSGVEIAKSVDLVGGDEIEVYVYQSIPATPLNIVAGSDKSFLQVVAERGVN